MEKGYGLIGIDGKLVRAHRLSYLLHHGGIPDGIFVCHRCDNPPCVNPAHLFLGDNDANCADRDAKGRTRYVFGERSHKAILTEDAVRDIRTKRLSLEQYAVLYGLKKDSVRDVQRRRCWKHIP